MHFVFTMQCQVRFGGQAELATDGDSRVSCLCAQFEAVLQHGLRYTNKAFSALRYMYDIDDICYWYTLQWQCKRICVNDSYCKLMYYYNS